MTRVSPRLERACKWVVLLFAFDCLLACGIAIPSRNVPERSARPAEECGRAPAHQVSLAADSSTRVLEALAWSVGCASDSLASESALGELEVAAKVDSSDSAAIQALLAPNHSFWSLPASEAEPWRQCIKNHIVKANGGQGDEASCNALSGLLSGLSEGARADSASFQLYKDTVVSRFLLGVDADRLITDEILDRGASFALGPVLGDSRISFWRAELTRRINAARDSTPDGRPAWSDVVSFGDADFREDRMRRMARVVTILSNLGDLDTEGRPARTAGWAALDKLIPMSRPDRLKFFDYLSRTYDPFFFAMSTGLQQWLDGMMAPTIAGSPIEELARDQARWLATREIQRQGLSAYSAQAAFETLKNFLFNGGQEAQTTYVGSRESAVINHAKMKMEARLLAILVPLVERFYGIGDPLPGFGGAGQPPDLLTWIADQVRNDAMAMDYLGRAYPQVQSFLNDPFAPALDNPLQVDFAMRFLKALRTAELMTFSIGSATPDTTLSLASCSNPTETIFIDGAFSQTARCLSPALQGGAYHAAISTFAAALPQGTAAEQAVRLLITGMNASAATEPAAFPNPDFSVPDAGVYQTLFQTAFDKRPEKSRLMRELLAIDMRPRLTARLREAYISDTLLGWRYASARGDAETLPVYLRNLANDRARFDFLLTKNLPQGGTLPPAEQQDELFRIQSSTQYRTQTAFSEARIRNAIETAKLTMMLQTVSDLTAGTANDQAINNILRDINVEGATVFESHQDSQGNSDFYSLLRTVSYETLINSQYLSVADKLGNLEYRQAARDTVPEWTALEQAAKARLAVRIQNYTCQSATTFANCFSNISADFVEMATYDVQGAAWRTQGQDLINSGQQLNIHYGRNLVEKHERAAALQQELAAAEIARWVYLSKQARTSKLINALTEQDLGRRLDTGVLQPGNLVTYYQTLNLAKMKYYGAAQQFLSTQLFANNPNFRRWDAAQGFMRAVFSRYTTGMTPGQANLLLAQKMVPMEKIVWADFARNMGRMASVTRTALKGTYYPPYVENVAGADVTKDSLLTDLEDLTKAALNIRGVSTSYFISYYTPAAEAENVARTQTFLSARATVAQGGGYWNGQKWQWRDADAPFAVATNTAAPVTALMAAFEATANEGGYAAGVAVNEADLFRALLDTRLAQDGFLFEDFEALALNQTLVGRGETINLNNAEEYAEQCKKYYTKSRFWNVRQRMYRIPGTNALAIVTPDYYYSSTWTRGVTIVSSAQATAYAVEVLNRIVSFDKTVWNEKVRDYINAANAMFGVASGTAAAQSRAKDAINQLGKDIAELKAYGDTIIPRDTLRSYVADNVDLQESERPQSDATAGMLGFQHQIDFFPVQITRLNCLYQYSDAIYQRKLSSLSTLAITAVVFCLLELVTIGLASFAAVFVGIAAFAGGAAFLLVRGVSFAYAVARLILTSYLIAAGVGLTFKTVSDLFQDGFFLWERPDGAKMYVPWDVLERVTYINGGKMAWAGLASAAVEYFVARTQVGMVRNLMTLFLAKAALYWAGSFGIDMATAYFVDQREFDAAGSALESLLWVPLAIPAGRMFALFPNINQWAAAFIAGAGAVAISNAVRLAIGSVRPELLPGYLQVANDITPPEQRASVFFSTVMADILFGTFYGLGTRAELNAMRTWIAANPSAAADAGYFSGAIYSMPDPMPQITIEGTLPFGSATGPL